MELSSIIYFSCFPCLHLIGWLVIHLIAFFGLKFRGPVDCVKKQSCKGWKALVVKNTGPLNHMLGFQSWAQFHRATQARKSAKHENSPTFKQDYKPHPDIVSTVLDSHFTLLCLARIKKRSLDWPDGPLNPDFLRLSKFWCLSSSMKLGPVLPYQCSSRWWSS
jgi:hypothetical protein